MQPYAELPERRIATRPDPDEQPHPSHVERRLLAGAMAVAAALALAAALAGVPARATYGAQVSGDEPQYLLTATSLAEDGELDLRDEIDGEAYLDYHEVPIDPQSAQLDDGRLVSPHDPLLPALLAPAMWAGGWVAAKAFLALVAAATAALTVWVAVRRLGVRAHVAALVVGAASVGIPLAAYGSQVYPELPAALTALVAVAAITSPRPRPALTATVLVALVALPWLSVKYVPVAAALGAGWLLRRARAAPGDRRWRSVLVPIGVVVVAAIAYVVAHRAWYGGFTVYAAGDHFVDPGEFSVVGTDLDLLGRSRRLVGLLVDERFGLAAWSPLWLLAPVAMTVLVRRRITGRWLLVAAVAVGWLNASFVALTMHGWWVPGRQVVVVLPLVVLALAALVDAWPWLRGPVAGLGGVSALTWWWLALESSTGSRTLIVDFAETAAPGYRLFTPIWPDGIRASTGDDLGLLAWAAALLVSAAIAWRIAGRRSSSADRVVGDGRVERVGDTVEL